MHTEISFPNLGIYLKNVGKSIDLFGIEIAYYGIIIGTAILLGFWIAAREAKRTGQNPENYLDMGIIGVIANRLSVYPPNASLLKKFPHLPSICPFNNAIAIVSKI